MQQGLAVFGVSLLGAASGRLAGAVFGAFPLAPGAAAMDKGRGREAAALGLFLKGSYDRTCCSRS